MADNPQSIDDLAGQVIGKEFHVAIMAADALSRSEERMDEYASRGIVDNLRTLGRKLMRKPIRNPALLEQSEGAIQEVISRRPGIVNSYSWGDIYSASFDDGTPISATVPKGKTFDNYIFIPQQVESSPELPVVFKGTLTPYSSSTNQMQHELERRALLYFNKIPSRGSFGTSAMPDSSEYAKPRLVVSN